MSIENQADGDKGMDLLRHKVNRSDSSLNANEYYLTVTVPREITHSF